MNDEEQIAEIRSALGRDDIPKALEGLRILCKGSAIIDQVEHQSARFRRIEKQIHLGTVSNEEANVEKNKILLSLSSLLKEVEGQNSSFQVISLPFPKPTSYISRQIFKKNDNDTHREILFKSKASCELLPELEQHNYIVLLGEAGMGKSTELEWFCYLLHESEQYIPVYKKLSIHHDFMVELPSFDRAIEEKIVLVLDGLDETNMLSTKQSIEKFVENHPKTKVLVSCRSNAYADTLRNFKTYILGKLPSEEIRAYTQEKLGSFSETFFNYWHKRYGQNTHHLIDNPFFLVRICQYIQENENKLPDSLGEVFEYLIEKSLDARLKSISNFDDGNLIEVRKRCRNSLEKLAFVMECRGEKVISKAELEQLISDKAEREVLLKKSSLIEFQEYFWRFAHNNFQEYLAAKALSRAKKFKAVQRAIGAKPNYHRLKWSWINALSFLLGLLEDGNQIKTHLIDWLKKNDVEALIKIASFEKERISQADRERIFKIAFESCKKEDLIVGYRHYNYWEMAEFGESSNIIRYLTAELKKAKTSTVKNNALVLLKSMHGYSVPFDIRAELRSELFRNIYDFGTNAPVNRHFAMEALIHLFDDLTRVEAAKMVDTFFDSENAQERSSVYKLIHKNRLQVDFMERLVIRSQQLRDYSWQKGKVRLVDESWRMEKCFTEIRGEETLVRFFEKYSGIVENKWSNDQKPLNIMLEKLSATALSQQGIAKIFEAMKKQFCEFLNSPRLQNRDTIIQFIRKNSLDLEFFKYCIGQNEIRVSVTFLNTEGINFLIEKFKNGDLSKEWMADYQQRVAINNKEILPPLNVQLNQVSKEPFPWPEMPPLIDYNEEHVKRLLEEKALYFNKEKYVVKIEEIFAAFGKERFRHGEIYEVRFENEYVDDGYPISLIKFINERHSKTKSELIKIIHKDWDWIYISQLKEFLTSYHREIESNPELDLNVKEIRIIKNWCDAYASTMNLNERITNGDIVFAWFVIKYKFTHYPETVYLQMAGSALQNHLDLNIIDFILEHGLLPFQQLKEHILETLRSLPTSKMVRFRITNYLKFIETHQVYEALEFFPRFIENDSESSHFRHFALNIFIALNGSRDYLLGLLGRLTPESDDIREQILLDHFVRKPNREFEEILLEKLSTATSPEHRLKYARYLVRLSNLTGLRFLTDYIKRERKSPFSDPIETHNYRFENPAGISLMLQLIDFGHDTSIPQDDFNSISSAGRNMLSHLAACKEGVYFDKVYKALSKRIKWHGMLNRLPSRLKKGLQLSSPESLKTMKYLLRDLEFQYYQKQEMTLEEILENLKRL